VEIRPLGRFEERADSGETVVAEFDNEEAAGFEVTRGLRYELPVEFVAFFAAEEGGGGFVVADFGWEVAHLFSADVGRVGDYEIEEKRCTTSGGSRERVEQIGFEECDAIRKAEAGGAALGDDEGGGGDVGGVDQGAGEFFGECDGDAARAGADVDDGETFTGEFGIAARAEFADGQAVESYFDEVLGFRARDEDVGSDFEFEAPEFLFAGEVLRGFAGGAAAEEREIRFDCLGIEDFFGVGVEPGAVAAGDVEEEEFGGECVGGDVGFADEVDALF
jgi:hypothetical protein